MAERNYPLLDKQELSVSSKKRLRVLQNETAFATEEFDDMDRPEELLLPDEHLAKRDGIIMKLLTTSTLTEEEEEDDEIGVRQHVAKNDRVCSRVKVSSGCMCKLFVVMYLLGCLLVSTLYIAIYGPNELYLLPETTHKATVKPTPLPTPFVQLNNDIYTEWISQRWTYDADQFSDWPSLPEYISMIEQVISGEINGKQGVWLLDTEGLYFMYDINGSSFEDVALVNISDNLDLYINEGTKICLRSYDSLYVLVQDHVTLLDCSQTAVDYCDIVSQWTIDNNDTVSATVVSSSDGHIWIGTDHGLYRLNTTQPLTAMPPYKGDDNDKGIFTNGDNTIVNQFVLMNEIEEPVLSLAWRGGLVGPKGWGLQGNAFILTNYSDFYDQNVSYSNGGDLYIGKTNLFDTFGLLVIGTESKLYFYNGHNFWFEWVSKLEKGFGGVVDASPVTLTFVPTGQLFIGNKVSLSRLNNDYTFDCFGGLEGLPYDHILSLHYSSFSPISSTNFKPSSFDNCSRGTLWIGTEKGWSLFDINDSKFIGYFYGPRWHSGSYINDITSVDINNMTILLTDKGVAIVTGMEFTLERKAVHYQEMLTRHVREPGLVSDCNLVDFIPSSCAPGPTDNDGLWTSWLVAAEAIRYQVTNDREAWTNAWKYYKGMKFLVDVTGINGLPARSVVNINISNVDDDGSGLGEEPTTLPSNKNYSNISNDSTNWHSSNTCPGWIWKGDTSSDEIVGHIFANTIAYDLLAKTPLEKQEIVNTLNSIIGYIMNNNYTLIDITNHTTRSGVWSPSVINLNQSWAKERGLNSLQILTGLLSAFRITGNTEYYDNWKELFDNSGYGMNMINQKITSPLGINDELAFLPYFVYFQSLKHLHVTDSRFRSDEMHYIPMLSLNKAWRSVKDERSAAWHSIYGNITGDNSVADDIIWSLRNWPLELVQWKTENSHRLDIQFRKGVDRFAQTQSITVLSPRERTQLRWNVNPYRLDYTGSNNEMDPGPWLMSYWLAKWTKLL